MVKVLSEHGLTERHARALLRLPNEQLQLKVLKIVTDRAFSVAETELLISRHWKLRRVIRRAIVTFPREKEPARCRKTSWRQGCVKRD